MSNRAYSRFLKLVALPIMATGLTGCQNQDVIDQITIDNHRISTELDGIIDQAKPEQIPALKQRLLAINGSVYSQGRYERENDQQYPRTDDLHGMALMIEENLNTELSGTPDTWNQQHVETIQRQIEAIYPEFKFQRPSH